MHRWSRAAGIAIVFTALTVGGAGCRHAPVSDSSAGVTAFHFINPQSPPSAKTAPSATISESRDPVIDAQAIPPLATPVYPAAVRSAKPGVITMGVRVTIDPAGRVSDIAPTLVGIAVPEALAREFRRSIDAALAQWRFQPAEVHHFEEATDNAGKTYLRLASREKIPAVFEVAFTFTETGEVRTGAGRR